MANKTLQNLATVQTVSESELAAFVPLGPGVVPARYLRRVEAGINETDQFQYIIRKVNPSDFSTPEDYARRFYIDAHAGRAYAIGSMPLTMRTLTGIPTPGYPVGVFSVSNKFLGQATSDTQFAQLWNTDAENLALGALTATDTARVFSLALSASNLQKATPIVPVAVTGHRYYQVDIVGNNLLDVLTCPLNSFIDFGDKTPIQFIDVNSVADYDVSGGVKPNKWFRTQVKPGDRVYGWLRGGYEATDPAIYWEMGQGQRSFGYWYAASGNYTVTVYHPEGDFLFWTDNRYGTTANQKLANLRGNFPAGMRIFSPQGTTQATMNTWANINMSEWKSKLEYFGYRWDGGSNNNNMAAFVLKDFSAIRMLDLTWQTSTAIPITQLTGGSLDIGATWPNLVSLHFCYQNYVVGVDLSKLFKLKEFFFTGNTNSPNEIDNYWMALANCMNIPGGRIKIYNTRTAASNAAYAALMAKGISVYSY